MLEVSEAVDVRHPAEISFAIEGREVAKLEGETVYAAPAGDKFNVGVELRGEWARSLESLLVRFQANPEEKGVWGKDAESIQHAIKEMPMPEKIQLAIKGGAAERRILMKDTHYAMHPYVLKNPRITQDEVAQFARMGTLTADMIGTISNTSEWMKNPAIRLAIIKNPKTPLPVVNKHIAKLGDGDLMALAKSENVRDGVSKAARRVLGTRGKTIR